MLSDFQAGLLNEILQCGENCTGMRAMPVGKLSKTEKIKESYQNIYGQMSINVENPKALIFVSHKFSYYFLNLP